MSALPRISGRECVKIITKAGFITKRQHGSHIVLRRDQPFAQVIVPDHTELDRGTLRAIIRKPACASMISSSCALTDRPRGDERGALGAPRCWRVPRLAFAE